MAKRKLKIGTIIGFEFAGQKLMGEIKAIKVDMGYSVRSEWYTVEHSDGTIYPLRVDNETIKQIKL